MSYTKTNWQNNQAPAINAANLNKMEDGIEEAHDDLADHEADTTNPHQVTLEQARTQNNEIAGDIVNTADGAGLILTTPDGTKKYRIAIDDSGDVTTTEIV